MAGLLEGFTFLSAVFLSYQNNGRVIMEGSEEKSAV